MSTSLSGINDQGQIVGTYWLANSDTRPFIYEKGAFRTIELPFPGATFANARGINNEGQIVGTFFDTHQHGYLYDRGVFFSIDVPPTLINGYSSGQGTNGINSGGDIVGTYSEFGNNGYLAIPNN